MGGEEGTGRGEQEAKRKGKGADIYHRMTSHKEENEPTRDPEKSKVGRENDLKGKGCKQGPQTAEGTATQW